jgi:hypothetical protein
MLDWLEQLMQGIDPDAPDATLQLFLRLMGLVDWWLLLWITLGSMAVGALIGWRRGTLWRDVGLAAALGPLGWIVSFLLPLPGRRCSRCGHVNPPAATACARCGAAAQGQRLRKPK